MSIPSTNAVSRPESVLKVVACRPNTCNPATKTVEHHFPQNARLPTLTLQVIGRKENTAWNHVRYSDKR